jgi:beta-xylosidase
VACTKADLACADCNSSGGTGANHMETMARSQNLTGPYESNPANPVLTAANTTNFCMSPHLTLHNTDYSDKCK